MLENSWELEKENARRIKRQLETASVMNDVCFALQLQKGNVPVISSRSYIWGRSISNRHIRLVLGRRIARGK